MKKSRTNILIVDDDPHILFTLKTLLERYFSNILVEKNPSRIPSVINNEQIDAVLLDMNFASGETSGEEGLNWIKRILEVDPNVSVVPITAYGGINMAVEALKAGAVDFVLKPWQNEKIVSTVTSAVNYSKSKRNITKLTEQKQVLSDSINSPTEIIGISKNIRDVIETVQKVAKTDANILLLGENGTGKELIARNIHRLSERKNESFVSVDLGSISQNLFESELFGYNKGAFTDAKENRIGRIEAAEGGTLFLDEIGNIPLSLQTKLLSVLQNREIIRLGSAKPIEINVRLISATNINIHNMVDTNDFRSDLLYRINTVEIMIPPLRNRIDDIPLLAQHFLEKLSSKYKKRIQPLSESVIQLLKQYEWPGNIRELQHAIERAVILCNTEEIKVTDFQFRIQNKEFKPIIDNYNLENLEKWAIHCCLEKHSGNITKAAEELGLTRGALYRRLGKHEI